jgi:hypothetical protein
VHYREDTLETEQSDFGFFDFVFAPINLVVDLMSAPVVLIGDMFDSGRDDARYMVNDFFSRINLDEAKDKLKSSKSSFVELLQGETTKDLLQHLIDEAESSRGTIEEKHAMLATVSDEIESLTSQMKNIEIEVNNLKTLVKC